MKTKHLPLLLLMIVLVPTLGFKTVSKAQDYRIAIGIAYTDMNCSGLTVKTAFGYDYRTARGGSISELSSQVKSEVVRYKRVSSDDVVMKTGYRSNAIIISYKKKISGWNCEKTMYAVGFGDSYEDAKNDAVENMESSNASYTVIKHITV